MVMVEGDAVLSLFSDQAYNLILLAEDESRMLGRSRVEPEHLLLALTRRGNVESLLARRGITATDIYGVIVSGGGLGQELVLGRVPRSDATDAALERAVGAAAEQGISGPSSEHVLLGLGGAPGAMAILRSVGVDDSEGLVSEVYPVRRVASGSRGGHGLPARLGRSREPPQPGPVPPVFERFTAEAHTAIVAVGRFAGEGVYVEPFHLLFGLLEVGDGVAALSSARHGATLEQVLARAEHAFPGRSFPPQPRRPAAWVPPGPPPGRRLPTQLFTDAARRVVAEGALAQAHHRGHRAIGTGHVLLAVLDTGDGPVSELLGGKDLARRISADVIEALPGDEGHSSS
jgi:ATP-dependent Clp protease ATP-binding subunit ClpA